MIRIFLICSGLGNVMRGYESFTQECYTALFGHPMLDIMLFQGGNTNLPNSITLKNLPRDYPLTQYFASFYTNKTALSNAYFLEQATFCLSLIPHLLLKRPNIVYFSDFILGTMLWHWRRISNLPYKLLFSNGAPNGPPFSRMDHVQHLTPIHYHIALDAGESKSKHSLVPYGINISPKNTLCHPDEQVTLRRALNLPTDRPIVLSVAAINKTHKRIDYLIREVASLPEPRPYLLLLGQIEQESSEIVQLGYQLLGTNNFQTKTVSSKDISNYYRIADLFTLTSLNEGFGRVLIEAMQYGLPCLVHDYAITRFVLKDYGFFADLTVRGALATLIKQVLVQDIKDTKHLRHQFVYERFSWDNLIPSYVKMFQKCYSRQVS